MSTLFSSSWPIDRIISGATTSGQSGLGSDGNKELLGIPQSSSVTGITSSEKQSLPTGQKRARNLSRRQQYYDRL